MRAWNNQKQVAFLHTDTSHVDNEQERQLFNFCQFQHFLNLSELHTSLYHQNNTIDLLVIEVGTHGEIEKILNDSLWKEIAQKCELPFIVIVPAELAKDASALRTYFQFGAKDLLIRPFGPIELMVKVENILQNKNFDIPYLTDNLILKLDGKKVKDLTIKQAQLLSLFLKSPDRTARRDDIKQSVWQNIAIHPKTIDVHLYNLRRKLAGYGYMIKSMGEGRWTLTPTSK